jgi:hypothetical protein
MPRARKRQVAAAIVASCALAWPAAAHAFHAGNVFDKPPGAGGGGGVFYTGAAKEKGWTCTACHTEAAGAIRVSLASEPADLLRSFRYEPGATYALTATLEGEHAGVGAGGANFNSLAVAILAPDGTAAGTIDATADEFYAGGDTTIISIGQKPNETKWTFKWKAPAAAGVPVKIHMAAVDGNGAGGSGQSTLTDPWGDDVFVGALDLDSAKEASRAETHDVRAAFGALLVFGLFFKRGGKR